MTAPVLLEAAAKALRMTVANLQHRDRRARLGLVDAEAPFWSDRRCVFVTQESLQAAVAGRAAFRASRRAAKEAPGSFGGRA